MFIYLPSFLTLLNKLQVSKIKVNKKQSWPSSRSAILSMLNPHFNNKEVIISSTVLNIIFWKKTALISYGFLKSSSSRQQTFFLGYYRQPLLLIANPLLRPNNTKGCSPNHKINIKSFAMNFQECQNGFQLMRLETLNTRCF